jgi:hypothetical protein
MSKGCLPNGLPAVSMRRVDVLLCEITNGGSHGRESSAERQITQAQPYVDVSELAQARA